MNSIPGFTGLFPEFRRTQALQDSLENRSLSDEEGPSVSWSTVNPRSRLARRHIDHRPEIRLLISCRVSKFAWKTGIYRCRKNVSSFSSVSRTSNLGIKIRHMFLQNWQLANAQVYSRKRSKFEGPCVSYMELIGRHWTNLNLNMQSTMLVFLGSGMIWHSTRRTNCDIYIYIYIS